MFPAVSNVMPKGPKKLETFVPELPRSRTNAEIVRKKIATDEDQPIWVNAGTKYKKNNANK
jgi:hypothetical protein